MSPNLTFVCLFLLYVICRNRYILAKMRPQHCAGQVPAQGGHTGHSNGHEYPPKPAHTWTGAQRNCSQSADGTARRSPKTWAVSRPGMPAAGVPAVPVPDTPARYVDGTDILAAGASIALHAIRNQYHHLTAVYSGLNLTHSGRARGLRAPAVTAAPGTHTETP